MNTMKLMLEKSVAILLIAFSLSYGNKEKQNFKFLVKIDSSVLSSVQFKEIDQAYQRKSLAEKQQYFKKWKELTDSLYRLPISQDEVCLRIYSLFESTFSPDTVGVKDLFSGMSKDIGNTPAGKQGIEGMRAAKYKFDGFPKDAKYTVLQSTIKYTICDSSESKFSDEPGVCSNAGEITNFHPKVRFYNKPILIATKPYDAGIPSFLMDKSMKVYEPNSRIDNDELYRKKEFLRPELEIVHSNKKIGWYFHTFPVVHYMNFNHTLDVISMIYSKSPDELYCTRYRYDSGKWKLIGMCNTGRE